MEGWLFSDIQICFRGLVNCFVLSAVEGQIVTPSRCGLGEAYGHRVMAGAIQGHVRLRPTIAVSDLACAISRMPALPFQRDTMSRGCELYEQDAHAAARLPCRTGCFEPTWVPCPDRDLGAGRERYNGAEPNLVRRLLR